MLIAEELVLLALDPDGRPARGASNQPPVATGVTGALVAELAQRGHLDIHDGRIRLTGSRPANPLLAQVLDHVAPHEGKKLKRRLGSIKRSGWREVVEGMIAQGIVGREKPFLRPTRHPVADRAAHAALRAELQAAATGTGPLDARTATLLALAGPCHLLEVVAPARADRGVAKRRIAEAAEHVEAAEAVKHTIEAAQAAVAATVVIAAAGSS